MSDQQIVEITIRVENNIKELISHLEQYLQNNQFESAKEAVGKVKKYCLELRKALKKIKAPSLQKLTAQEATYLKQIENITQDMINNENHLARDAELLTKIEHFLDEVNSKEQTELKQVS